MGFELEPGREEMVLYPAGVTPPEEPSTDTPELEVIVRRIQIRNALGPPHTRLWSPSSTQAGLPLS
jgi:hypothetical protein